MKERSSQVPQTSKAEDIIVDSLQDEAFSLIYQRHELSYQDEITQVYIKEYNFKKRSEQHQKAFQYAEAEWELLGQVKSIELNISEKSRLFVEQKTASLIEHPKQILALSAAILIAIILPFTDVFEQPAAPMIAHQHSKTNENIQNYHTGYGYQSEYILSDGTHVKLNWHTNITVKMSENQRLITLTQGEANFKVAKDPYRPFIISVDNVKAQAIGTEFTVKRVTDKYANIAVSEGVVEVKILSPQKRPQQNTLIANQTISSENDILGAIKNKSLEEINAWREGIIIFDKHPLHEALKEINRYTSFDIVIKLPPVNNDEVTATFFIDSANDALDSLTQLFNLHIEKQNNTVIISAAPS